VYTRFLYPSPVANGLAWFHVGEPVVDDKVKLLAELSARKDPDTVLINNTVDDIGEKGVVGTV